MEKLEIRYNHEWLEKLTFKDILRLTGNFTVQQMLHRDMFAKRMKEDAPISLTEFMYPLMVGYDSVMLDVDVELGGNDQLFNMLAGRTLQTAFKKRDKFVLTTKLIDGTDGRKMSKTYNNCVYLTDAPNEMYGRLLSMPDNLIPLYMECCTDIPMTEVKACELALKGGKENPKVLKMRLAREIVTMYHSKEAAAHAEAEFENVFKNKGLPEDIQEFKAKKGMLLIDALAESKIVTSKSEARRLIEQGGIRIDDKPVTAMDAKAEKGIVRVGKRKFLKIA
jgi:tyrosyl-tRNA synthetase